MREQNNVEPIGYVYTDELPKLVASEKHGDYLRIYRKAYEGRSMTPLFSRQSPAYELTAAQIVAGAAVLGDDNRPVGRNTAIMVADAIFPIHSPAPIPEQVAQASGIEGLTRYHPNIPMGRMHECADGDYVSFTDVECLLANETAWHDATIVDLSSKLVDAESRLATQSAKQGAQPDIVQVPRVTLLAIYEAMNYMGDILNEMDACEDEDEEKTTPAFDAIRELLDDSYIPGATQATVEQAPVAQEVTQQASKAETDSVLIADQLRAALRSAELGRGSYHINYDGNKLATAIEAIIAPTTSTVSASGALAATDDVLTDAARDVLAERRRQVEQEGWTPTHDDQYDEGELSRAAAAYALQGEFGHGFPDDWPWPKEWWKPAGDRRNLVKAGALILADIERIDRAAQAATDKSED